MTWLTEVPETVNHDELGNLPLSDADEDGIIAFLLTLTDAPVSGVVSAQR